MVQVLQQFVLILMIAILYGSIVIEDQEKKKEIEIVLSVPECRLSSAKKKTSQFGEKVKGATTTPLLLLPHVQVAEAGIPGLHKWMLETFPSAAQRFEDTHPAIQTDHVLFDLNQLLHQAAASVKKRRWRDDSVSAGDCVYKRGRKSDSFLLRNGSLFRTKRHFARKNREHATMGGRRDRVIITPRTSSSQKEDAVEGLTENKGELFSEGKTFLGAAEKRQDMEMMYEGVVVVADEDEDIVLKRFLHLLSATLRRVRPRRSIVFALDGVPPLAKFLTATTRHQRSQIWQRKHLPAEPFAARSAEHNQAENTMPVPPSARKKTKERETQDASELSPPVSKFKMPFPAPSANMEEPHVQALSGEVFSPLFEQTLPSTTSSSAKVTEEHPSCCSPTATRTLSSMLSKQMFSPAPSAEAAEDKKDKKAALLLQSASPLSRGTPSNPNPEAPGSPYSLGQCDGGAEISKDQKVENQVDSHDSQHHLLHGGEPLRSPLFHVEHRHHSSESDRRPNSELSLTAAGRAKDDGDQKKETHTSEQEIQVEEMSHDEARKQQKPSRLTQTHQDTQAELCCQPPFVTRGTAASGREWQQTPQQQDRKISSVEELCEDSVEDVEDEITTETDSLFGQRDGASRYRIHMSNGAATPYVLIPGTRFMRTVEEACRRFARRHLLMRPGSNLRFFISGTNSYGEGELKLLDWLNAHRFVGGGERQSFQQRNSQPEEYEGSSRIRRECSQPSASGSACSHPPLCEEWKEFVSYHAGTPLRVPPTVTATKKKKKRRATDIDKVTAVDGGNNISERPRDSATNIERGATGSDGNNIPEGPRSPSITKTFHVRPTDSIVIVGGDGDLLVQALACPGVPNLHIYCPQRLLDSGSTGRHFRGRSHLVRNDLALLCLLNGNDYLPRAAGFTFHHFFEAYAAVRKRPVFKDASLVDAVNRTFNREFFLAFLEELNCISSLWRLALQQLSAPPPGTAGCFSPLAIVNQLVAQGYIKTVSNSTNQHKAACALTDNDVRETRVDREHSQDQAGGRRFCRGRAKSADASPVGLLLPSSTEKQESVQCNATVTGFSTLQWRYEGNSPFGSGNFRATLSVPCKALPILAEQPPHGTRSPIESNSQKHPPPCSISNSDSLGLVVGDEDRRSGVKEVFAPESDPGAQEGFVCFTGHARDKKGAQQQAALALLQRYFPAWVKYVVLPVETNEKTTVELQGGGNAGEKTTKEEEQTNEQNVNRQSRDTQKKQHGQQAQANIVTGKQQFSPYTVPKKWRLAAPLFAAAASTLQPTSPANTLNNLCLKVFKQPAKLWHIPQNSTNSAPMPDSVYTHCGLDQAPHGGSSAAAGGALASLSSDDTHADGATKGNEVVSPNFAAGSHVGAVANADSEEEGAVNVSPKHDGDLLEPKTPTSTGGLNTDHHGDGKRNGSPAIREWSGSSIVTSAGSDNCSRPSGQDDTLIALDVGDLRLFSASSDRLVKQFFCASIDRTTAVKEIQKLTSNRRQTKHCFSMQVLQWLAPSLYSALLAGGWKPDGSLISEDNSDVLSQMPCDSQFMSDETRQPKISPSHTASATAQQSPVKAPAHQTDPVEGGVHAREAAQQTTHLPTSGIANIQKQVDHLSMHQTLTSYFSPEDEDISCSGHSTQGDTASTVQHSIEDGSAQPSSNEEQTGREAGFLECSEMDRDVKFVKSQVDMDTARVYAYLKGLLWNVQMYVSGICPDTRWYFPYRKAPSLYSVQEHLKRGLDAHLSTSGEHTDGTSTFLHIRTNRWSPPIPAHPTATKNIAPALFSQKESSAGFMKEPLHFGNVSLCDVTAPRGPDRLQVWTAGGLPLPPPGNPVSPALYAAAVLPPVVFHWLQFLPDQSQYPQGKSGAEGMDSGSTCALKYSQKALLHGELSGSSSAWSVKATHIPAEALVIERGLGSAFARALLQARGLLEHIICAERRVSAMALASSASSETARTSAATHCHINGSRTFPPFGPASSTFSDGKNLFPKFSPVTASPVLSGRPAQLDYVVGEYQYPLEATGALHSVRGLQRQQLLPEGLSSHVPMSHIALPPHCSGELSALVADSASVPFPPALSIQSNSGASMESTGQLLTAAQKGAAPANPPLSPRHILSASIVLLRAAASRALHGMETGPLLEMPSARSGDRFTGVVDVPDGLHCNVKRRASSRASLFFPSTAQVVKNNGGSEGTTDSLGLKCALHAASSMCVRCGDTTTPEEAPVTQGLCRSTRNLYSSALDGYLLAVMPQPRQAKVQRRTGITEDSLLVNTDEKQDTRFDVLPLLCEDGSKSVWTCIVLLRSGGERSVREQNEPLFSIKKHVVPTRTSSATVNTVENVRRRKTGGKSESKMESSVLRSIGKWDGTYRDTVDAAVEFERPLQKYHRRQPAAALAAPVWRHRSTAQRELTFAEEEVPLFSSLRMGIPWTKLSTLPSHSTNVSKYYKVTSRQQRFLVPNSDDSSCIQGRDEAPYFQVHSQSCSQLGNRVAPAGEKTETHHNPHLQQALTEQEQQEATLFNRLSRNLRDPQEAPVNSSLQERDLCPLQQVEWSKNPQRLRPLQALEESNDSTSIPPLQEVHGSAEPGRRGPGERQKPFCGAFAQQDKQRQGLSGPTEEQNPQTGGSRPEHGDTLMEARCRRDAQHDPHASSNSEPPVFEYIKIHPASSGGHTTTACTASSSPGTRLCLGRNTDMSGTPVRGTRRLGGHNESVSPLNLCLVGAAGLTGFHVRNESKLSLIESSNLCRARRSCLKQTSVYCSSCPPSSPHRSNGAAFGCRFSPSDASDALVSPSPADCSRTSIMPAGRSFRNYSPPRVAGSLRRFAAGSPTGFYFRPHSSHSFARLYNPAISVFQGCCESAQTPVSCVAGGNRNTLSLLRSTSPRDCRTPFAPMKADRHSFDAARTFLLTSVFKPQGTPRFQTLCKGSIGARQRATQPCCRTGIRMSESLTTCSFSAQGRAAAAAS